MVEWEREIEQLHSELRRQQQHTALLRDVALSSRGGVELRTVFQTIYSRLSEVLPIDAFFVALCEHEGAPEYRIAYMIDEGQLYELSDSRVGGLTSHVLHDKQPLLFRDLHREYYKRDLPSPDKYGQTEKFSRSWMAVPLLIGREAIGVMSAQSYSPGLFDEHDLELLGTLGDLAAISIENAMLWEAQEGLSQSLAERVTARSEELAVLTATAVSFSQGLPLGTVLNEVLERVQWLLGMDGGAIFVREPRTSLRRRAWRGNATLEPPAEWMPLDSTTLEARALQAGTLLYEKHDDYAVLALPLRAHGQSVGAMTLYGPLRDLSDQERSLLEAASYQIAVGLENSRLLRERERQIAQLEALTSIAAAGAATLDLNTMLEQVHAVLQTLLRLDGFVVATFNAESRTITGGLCWTHDGGKQPLEQFVLDPDTRLAYVLKHHRPILIHHNDPLHAEMPPLGDWEQGALSWLGAPMLGRDGKPLGILAIQCNRPETYDRRDQQFLSAVAHQLALNVENAQLYRTARATAQIAQQRAENLTLVHSISRLVNSSLDPEEVLGIAAEQLVQLFAVDHCGVVLYTGNGWRGKVVAEYPPLGVLHQRVAFANVEDFRNDVKTMGQPIYVADLSTDQRTRPIRDMSRRLGMQSLLIIPLISRGRAVGAIGLFNRTPREFSPEELELCRTIAIQVAIALENARLFQLSVTRIEQEMEIARSIQANLFPRHLPTIPHADLAARCVPARETGGDFYDVLPLGNNRFGLSVGDVSGKSLPAAMLMAVARSVVRSEALDHAEPAVVMAQTNELISQDVPPNTFVALCYAVYDATSRTLEVASGGQVTPLVRKHDGTTHFIEGIGNFPLGITQDEQYNTTCVQLHPGDTVLLYTDGLVEAFSPEHELFGFERLQQTFGECGNAPALEIVERLFTTIAEWQGSAPRHDDITTVVLNIT